MHQQAASKQYKIQDHIMGPGDTVRAFLLGCLGRNFAYTNGKLRLYAFEIRHYSL